MSFEPPPQKKEIQENTSGKWSIEYEILIKIDKIGLIPVTLQASSYKYKLLLENYIKRHRPEDGFIGQVTGKKNNRQYFVSFDRTYISGSAIDKIPNVLVTIHTDRDFTFRTYSICTFYIKDYFERKKRQSEIEKRVQRYQQREDKKEAERKRGTFTWNVPPTPGRY